MDFKQNLISEMSKLGVKDPEGLLASRVSTPEAEQSHIDPIYHHLDENSRAKSCTIDPWKGVL